MDKSTTKVLCIFLFSCLVIMASHIRIGTYNSNGFKLDRITYINRLKTNCDFILLQEHWLHESQLNMLENELDMYVHAISGMDSYSMHVGRPSGGCAILWRKDLGITVTPINSDSKRLCCSIVECDNLSFLLACVYMPCDTSVSLNNANEFSNLLCDIMVTSQLYNMHQIVIAGDLNTDFSRPDSYHTKVIEEFMDENSLKLCTINNIDYSYESKINGVRSHLDHIIVSENMCNLVKSVYVKHDGDNLSDHSPVIIDIACQSTHVPSTTKSPNYPRYNWRSQSASDTYLYQEKLNSLLMSIDVPNDALSCSDLQCQKHNYQIQLFHDNIVNCCLNASEHIHVAAPSHENSHRKTVIPGWNEYVSPYQEKALFWHSIWKENGSPRSGVLADIRNRTRLRYHYAIRFVQKNKSTMSANSMADSFLSNNHKEFWDEVSKNRRTKSTYPNSVDNISGPENIAELFANKSEDLYNCVSYNADEMAELYDEICNDIASHELSCEQMDYISTDNVSKGVLFLKPGKSDGLTGLTSDHVINGTHLLFDQITKLMSCMLKHGFAPAGICAANITPIPKNKKKSLYTSDNYRGIALSSIIGKLFDLIILSSNERCLNTSDLQFGFKSKHSTVQCTLAVNEVINYYVDHDTNVNCMLLDASKAFDRVEYVKLFRLLKDRKMCPLMLRLLLYMYTHQSVLVSWCNFQSNSFPTSNGVKQGGVLSPILFTVYVDELICKLHKSGYGCYVGHWFMGVFIYADDIILLAPTRMALNQMLKICNDFSQEYKVKFNPEKCKFMIFSPDHDCTGSINFNDATIHSSKLEIHLGNHIGWTASKHNINRSIKEMYYHTNYLKAMFNSCSSDVVYKLFHTYCMPLYGLQLWDLTDKTIESFYICWRKCIRNLLNLPYCTHNDLLQVIVNDIPADCQIHKRYLKFLHDLSHSDNEVMKMCFKLIKNGSNSPSANSFSLLCSIYDIDKDYFTHQHKNTLISKCRKNVTDHTVATGVFIRELLHIRDFKCERLDHIVEIIDYLCTM